MPERKENQVPGGKGGVCLIDSSSGPIKQRGGEEGKHSEVGVEGRTSCPKETSVAFGTNLIKKSTSQGKGGGEF